MISEQTLVELERLSKSRDSGPWTAVVEGRDAESGDSFIQTGPDTARDEDVYVTRSGPRGAAYLDLIAAARTWLPELVAEVRNARSAPSSPQPAGDGVVVRYATAPTGRLILLGYWAGPDTAGDWPSPADFVDPTWDEDQRSLVIDYLRQGQIARAYMGWSRCRLCGRDNGDLELTDGTYVWPSGLVHYVEGHDVRLPQHFVVHAEARIASIEEAARDEEWWRSARPEPPAAADSGARRPVPTAALGKPLPTTVLRAGDAPGVPAGQVHLLRVVDDLRRALAAESDGRAEDEGLERFLRSFSELLGGDGSSGSAGLLAPLDPWTVVADALREAGDRK